MPRFVYSAEHLEFICAAYATMTLADVTREFNRAFGANKSEKQIRAVTRNHRITCGRTHQQRIYKPKLMTLEQADWLRQAYTTLPAADLTEAFNREFGTRLHENQVRAFIKNHSMQSGRTGRFEKGQTSWNLGKRGYMGANRTSFKRGDIPHTKRRLWSERINKDGFVEISIPERNPYTGAPTRFRHKHVWLWEYHNGQVPAGHAVVFRDSDKTNVVIENLMLVTRAELLSMNLHGYREIPAELKPTVLALAKVEAKAGFRTRPGRGRRPRRRGHAED